MTQPREKHCEPDQGSDQLGIPDVHLTQPKGGLVITWYNSNLEKNTPAQLETIELQ